ncbi:MAG: hypothetical protein HS111_36045 [Kofleriaceae bacterium]|nr:hypothetical protein [Kofleriaceae bacterium]
MIRARAGRRRRLVGVRVDRGAQPMPVRQLAGMMRKRGLLDGDPEVLCAHLKAAALGDERSRAEPRPAPAHRLSRPRPGRRPGRWR